MTCATSLPYFGPRHIFHHSFCLHRRATRCIHTLRSHTLNHSLGSCRHPCLLFHTSHCSRLHRACSPSLHNRCLRPTTRGHSPHSPSRPSNRRCQCSPSHSAPFSGLP